MDTLLTGAVCSGRGKALHEVSRSMDELEALTGQVLFPGSLNVVLDSNVSFKVCHALHFDNGRRHLWVAHVGCHRVWLYRWQGAPFHVVEILSEVRLRDELGLVDGDGITITVSKAFIDEISMQGRLVSFLIWGLGRKHLYYHGDYADRHSLKVMRMRLRDGQW